jgi:hypothetical protein
MNSYIDEYNSLVDKKCKEELKVKKNKSVKNILSGNAKYIKELGGFITPETITKKQFMNGIKNVYKYLGKAEPKEPVLEDIYEKVFNSFTFEQFSQFMDMAQFGGYSNLNEAYNAFLDELRVSEGTAMPSVSGAELFEEESVESVTTTEPSSPVLSLAPSVAPSRPVTPPLTQAQQALLEFTETRPTSVFSEGLIRRGGRPVELEIPQQIKEEISQGGISSRFDPAEQIFRSMSE